MIPGPYAICRVELETDSDSDILHTIRWGYDSAGDAFKKLESVAAESGEKPEDCVVIRYIEREEVGKFVD